jgi:hypothetical protein
MRWRCDASTGRSSGASRILLGLQIFKGTGSEKEAVNKKEAARYAKEQKKCKRDNMLEKLASPYPWTHQKRAS